MPLLSRVYFNAVFGALGGLVGWLLFGVFGDPRASNQTQWLLGGAILGGSIGYFVVSVEAILDRSLLRFCRLASYGLVLGAMGGAGGMWLGEIVHYYIVEQIGTSPGGLAATLAARGLGWMILGMAVGVGEGIATRSFARLSYGMLGGALGGLIGGVFFGLLYLRSVVRQQASDELGILAGAIGLVILGACIGAFSALMPGVLIGASVRVLRGWQEGRAYLLAKSEISLGRDEHADIALFRDMRIEKEHAILRRERRQFVLVNRATPEQTLVNGEPVQESRELADGDRIQLGDVVLRFQTR